MNNNYKEWFPEIAEGEFVVGILEASTGIIMDFEGIKINGEDAPYKIFKNRTEALDWSKTFLEKHTHCMTVIFNHKEDFEYVSIEEKIKKKRWWQF